MATAPATESISSVAVSKRRISRLQKVLLVFTLLLSAAIVWVIVSAGPNNQVLLLTPDQFAQQTKPGPLTGLKNSIRNFAGPVWRRFRPPSPTIKITSQSWTVAPSMAEDMNLREPRATNHTGTGVWVLSPNQADILRSRLKTNSAASHLGSSGISSTGSGVRSSLFRGNSARANVPSTGTLIDLICKRVSGSIHLTLETRVTESFMSPTNTVSVRTNLAVACVATIPDGGCLVLENKNSGEPEGKHYWMLVTAELFDAKGKRIKP